MEKITIPKTALVQSETFLSAVELYDLTGFRSPKKQCEQLKNQRIPFFVNARGYPRVCRDVLFGKTTKSPQQPTQKSWQPKIQAA